MTVKKRRFSLIEVNYRKNADHQAEFSKKGLKLIHNFHINMF
ncbi:hypothetical protein N44_02985 [Microcystis aeruginosa NIES-44]|uniref:Uncharacterized protein n=1 Tax=Microcystis aeruginosa NIES-44 TaxID=449439 RepID=A0A0A1VXD8_MICAE|nr:hypothetical protein N44_02985 [Microcystis aeruginosa NIES-44]